eukprot:291274_1
MSHNCINEFHVEEQFGSYTSQLLIWSAAYLKQCPLKQSKHYQSWKKLNQNISTITNYNNIFHSWKKINKIKFNSTNMNDCAKLAINGLILLNNENYSMACKYLKQSNDIFPNSIVELALIESYLKTTDLFSDSPKELHKIKTIQKSLEFLLLKRKWKDILLYLNNSCCSKPMIADLNEKTKAMLCTCYHQRIFHKSKIKLRWIMKFDKTIQSLYDHGSYDNLKPIEVKNRLLTMIRLKYWLNKYMKAFKYFKIVFNLCKQHKFILDAHDNELCHLLLFRLNKYDIYCELAKHQTNICRIADTMCYEKNHQYPPLEPASLIFPFFYINTAGVYNEKEHGNMLEKLIEYKNTYDYHQRGGYYNVELIIGYHFYSVGNSEKANYYFVEPALNMVKHKINGNKLDNIYIYDPLYLAKWFFWLLYGNHIHFQVKNLKMAKYCYQIALDENPFDSWTYCLYGILLKQIGKYELSERKLQKAKSLNGFIFEKMSQISDVYVRILIYNECNYCGTKGYDFKKCKRCKVVVYCDKKCQKYDWNRKNHKNECILKEKLTAYDKVRPYLLRLSSKLYWDWI